MVNYPATATATRRPWGRFTNRGWRCPAPRRRGTRAWSAGRSGAARIRFYGNALDHEDQSIDRERLRPAERPGGPGLGSHRHAWSHPGDVGMVVWLARQTRGGTSCGTRAHVSAQWSDSGADGWYVGRTSLVTEYLGSARARGHPLRRARRTGIVGARRPAAICARLGSPDLPVDVGWLIHLVRPSADGSQMRSRFWMGGRRRRSRERHWYSPGGQVVRPVAARMLPDPRDLLVHCAREMNHLAGSCPNCTARLAFVIELFPPRRVLLSPWNVAESGRRPR